MTFKDLVIKTVHKFKVCTVLDVLSKIRKDITAIRAAKADRHYCRIHNLKAKLNLERGRKRIISECLRRLIKEKKIKRVGLGFYSKLDN